MTQPSTTVLHDYARLADRFGAVVDRLDDADWERDSPCEGWSARDVLHHVVSTQRDFLAKHGFDAGADADAEADPRGAWHAHDERLRDLLTDPAVAAHEYDGVFGRTTVGASIVTFYGFDLVVHRWDIAAAAGLDERFDDRELDMIESSADGFGEHLYDDGVCKPAVSSAADADRQARILARLGRRGTADVA
ncbi:MAG TPA: TIGR03086 family metal-binding protein [Humibacillus xanthopallidus]|nr:TIGR03086 family metal-binding protein [Humibacillus xanthopallidus]